MLKKILAIIILSVSICCAYKIYFKTIVSKNAYHYEYPFKPHFYVEEPLVIDDDFKLTDVIHVFSDEFSYLENREDGLIDVTLSNHLGKTKRSFSYRIKEKEKEIKYIYVTKYVDKQKKDNTVNSQKSDDKPSDQSITNVNEPYFTGYHDLKIPLGTSMEELAVVLSKDIRTSVQATVDYSQVQLDKKGVYQVTYLTEIGDFSINLSIF